MSAISQIVDERIEQIRKERAELDELRASLEKKEAEIQRREQEQDEDLGASSERKEHLVRELDNLTQEIERLREERNLSIESFGGELSKVHEERTAESSAHVKQLQNEIAFLLNGKEELETEIERVREELSELQEKARRDQTRVIEEKEALLTRTRAEREASLRELNLEHSVAVADLEGKKKELENEVYAMEQTRDIEWNKIQVEVSRYKTTQLAELNAQREEFLSELEKEKSAAEEGVRNQKHQQRAEISAERREWDKEIIKFESEKQKILDDMKLLDYEYEKCKADNILKIEKARVDEDKALEAYRAEALATLEEEQNNIIAAHRKEVAEIKSRIREEMANAENELNDYELRKSTIISEIDGLNTKFEQARTDNEATLEIIRSEKMREIDEQRLERIREIEVTRQERIGALETSYLEKAEYFENARMAKLNACRDEIVKTESEIAKLKHEEHSLTRTVEALRLEGNKIKEENEALEKNAIIERKLELETLANAKLAEVEEICKNRISAADERVTQLEADSHITMKTLAEDIATNTETLIELRRQISAQKLELEQQKTEKLAEMEQEKIIALDEVSKKKIDMLSGMDEYLENYKAERMENIRNDIARQSKMSYKQRDELVALNEDYNKRMVELQKLSLMLETEKENVGFKDEQIRVLQKQNQDMALRLTELEPLALRAAAFETFNEGIDISDIEEMTAETDLPEEDDSGFGGDYSYDYRTMDDDDSDSDANASASSGSELKILE